MSDGKILCIVNIKIHVQLNRNSLMHNWWKDFNSFVTFLQRQTIIITQMHLPCKIFLILKLLLKRFSRHFLFFKTRKLPPNLKCHLTSFCLRYKSGSLSALPHEADFFFVLICSWGFKDVYRALSQQTRPFVFLIS